MSDPSAQTPMVGDAQEESDSCVKKYFAKFAGAGAARPPRAAPAQTAQSFLGAFVGMSTLGLLTTYLLMPSSLHMSVEVPPYGAMSVILFSAFKVPVAQPYNAVVGNTLGGCVGVLVILAMKALSIESMLWLGGALSVSLTILVQELTGSVHPPGGATALLYAYTPALQSLTLGYILVTSLLGTVILVALAAVMNNLNPDRQYPQTWGNPFMAPPQPQFEPMKQTEMKDMKQNDPEDGTTSTGDSASEESCSMLRRYFSKFGGAGAAVEERKPLSYTVYSVFGSFVGMAAIGLLHTYVLMPLKPQEVSTLGAPMVLEVAAFGAMSVLLFSTWKAPLAQPVNTVAGNTIGGLVGVLVVEGMRLLGIEHMLWLGGALAVSLTIVAQEATGTVHPPGGATALLYVINAALHKMHFLFALSPACLGAIVMVSVAVLTNNIAPGRAYPQRWG